MPDLKYPRSRSKVRFRNYTRLLAAFLVFLLAVTAFVVALGKINDVKETAVVVTPVVIPQTPLPDPTPPPIEIPIGKTMDMVTIVIDAGHGGEDPGTISPYEKMFYEKDITIDIAKRVEAYLKESDINVILTRESDDRLKPTQKEDLIERATIANDNNASLFVSIHVNAYDLKYKGAANVNGMEVYYLNKKATYDDFDEEDFATIMGNQIQEFSGISFTGTRSDPLSVLRNTKMPAVLIETAYITNKEDHARLKLDDFREKTAKGIAEGIKLSLDAVHAFEYDGDLYVFKEVGE